MVRKARRLLGVSAFYLFLSLLLFGCSGQQQTEDGVEVSEQGEQGAEGENQAAEGQQGENVAQGQGEGNAAPPEGGEGGTEEASAGAAAGTENDLQEIIQEMNGQPAPNAAQAAPLAQNAAVAPPPPAAPEAAPAPAPTGPAPQGSAPIPFQPGGSPAGTGLPELGSKMAYVVEKGDTLGKISQKIFGNPSRWKELAELSGIANPSRIFPGDLVYYTLEEGAVSFAQAYEATARSEETVQPGDTLATIAKRVYGSTTGWRAIWRQNDKIDNPDIVPPGTTVYYLPHGSAVAALEKMDNKLNNTKSKNKIANINKKSETNKLTSNNNTSSKNIVSSQNIPNNKANNFETNAPNENADFFTDNNLLI